MDFRTRQYHQWAKDKIADFNGQFGAKALGEWLNLLEEYFYGLTLIHFLYLFLVIPFHVLYLNEFYCYS